MGLSLISLEVVAQGSGCCVGEGSVPGGVEWGGKPHLTDYDLIIPM